MKSKRAATTLPPTNLHPDVDRLLAICAAALLRDALERQEQEEKSKPAKRAKSAKRRPA